MPGQPMITTATGSLCRCLSLYFASQVVQRGRVPIRSGVGPGVYSAGACTLRAADFDSPADSVSGQPGPADRPGRDLRTASGNRGAQAVLVRVLLPRVHGTTADRDVLADCLTASVAGQPACVHRDECDRHPGSLRRKPDDLARRSSDVRGRSLQRHAPDDRVPRPDRGRGLPHHATGLVPRHRGSLSLTDCPDGERRSDCDDRLHHALCQSPVCLGHVSHA